MYSVTVLRWKDSEILKQVHDKIVANDSAGVYKILGEHYAIMELIKLAEEAEDLDELVEQVHELATEAINLYIDRAEKDLNTKWYFWRMAEVFTEHYTKLRK